MPKINNNVYTSMLLTRLGVAHGYSTRVFGDIRKKENKEKFLNQVGLRCVVMAEQVHGTKIRSVGMTDAGNIMEGYDGLISNDAALGVTFADCVPILAVDPTAGVIGTAHAGWKGTVGGIAKELIFSMKNRGATDIFISIGPHIGMCCYNVEEDRARRFPKQCTSFFLGKWHVDIGRANYQQLLDAGISKDHIDASICCTSCQVAEFNSFRKDTKETFGVQLGVITIT